MTPRNEIPMQFQFRGPGTQGLYCVHLPKVNGSRKFKMAAAKLVTNTSSPFISSSNYTDFYAKYSKHISESMTLRSKIPMAAHWLIQEFSLGGKVSTTLLPPSLPSHLHHPSPHPSRSSPFPVPYPLPLPLPFPPFPLPCPFPSRHLEAGVRGYYPRENLCNSTCS
jgi:hypothetical protein